MLLETGENRGPVEVILEEVYLPLIGQVVATRVEVVDVDPWQGDIMQVLI